MTYFPLHQTTCFFIPLVAPCKPLLDLLERTAENAAPEIAKYLVTGVTSGVSYDFLKSRLDIPCCKETYYDLYRRFFWLLDRERK